MNVALNPFPGTTPSSSPVVRDNPHEHFTSSFTGGTLPFTDPEIAPPSSPVVPDNPREHLISLLTGGMFPFTDPGITPSSSPVVLENPHEHLTSLLAAGAQHPDGSINWDAVEDMGRVLSQIVPSQVPPHQGPLMDPAEAIMKNGLDAYGIGGAMPTDHLGMPVFVPGGHEFMPPEMAAAIGLQALTEFAESFKAPLPGNPNVAMAPFALDLAIADELNQRISDYLGTPMTAYMPYPSPVPEIGYGMAPAAPPEPAAPPMPVAPPIPGFPALQ